DCLIPVGREARAGGALISGSGGWSRRCGESNLGATSRPLWYSSCNHSNRDDSRSAHALRSCLLSRISAVAGLLLQPVQQVQRLARRKRIDVELAKFAHQRMLAEQAELR